MSKNSHDGNSRRSSVERGVATLDNLPCGMADFDAGVLLTVKLVNPDGVVDRLAVIWRQRRL